MKLRHSLLALGISAFAVSATANTIVSTNSLQNGLNGITDGNFYDVNTAQHTPDEVWDITGSNGSISRLIFEFAGFENNAKFGIYDVNDSSNKLMIFDGASCGTADTSCAPQLNFASTGNIFGPTTFSTALFGQAGTSATFSSQQFGYYLTSNQGTFYSQSSLNTDVADAAHNNTTDHMIAFKGDGVTQIDISGTGANYGDFSTGEFILAWEDLRFPNSDYDYSDFVVLVESVVPVPEPGTLALLGLGLAGLGAARRRQKA